MRFTLFADEANPEQTDPTRFFVYGGIFVENEQIANLHQTIEELSRRYGLETSDQIKFNSRTRPKSLTVGKHSELKTEVMAAAAKHKVVFCGYAVLHAVAGNQSNQTLLERGANIILAKYNQFLAEKGSKGWAVFDRVNTEAPYQYLREKFERRNRVQGENVRLENIMGYSFTCDGASHLSSLADVVIGGFRYVVNEPKRDIAGKAIVKGLNPLWGHVRDGKGINIKDRGLVLRPKDIRKAEYLADYQEIRDRVIAWANS